MGNCLCLWTRAVNSKYTGKDGNELSGSGNRAPTTSVSTTTEGRIPQSYEQKSFTLDELRAATQGFNSKIELGKGRFGTVFKGWIDGHTLAPTAPSKGMAVAVKKLTPNMSQGLKQWLVEVKDLDRYDKPHLLQLIGHCSENEDQLLVYEFMPGGSLDKHLFGIDDDSEDYQPLSWAIRIKIALGAAKGLAYLHRENILFHDFKTANVLLDSEYNVKLSYFGLTRYHPNSPYAGNASPKNDVNSFSIVLLEMLTGKKASDSEIGVTLLLLTAPDSNIEILLNIMDPNMGQSYSQFDVEGACEVTHQCLSKDIMKRPTMDDVVYVLEVLHETAGNAAGLSKVTRAEVGNKRTLGRIWECKGLLSSKIRS